LVWILLAINSPSILVLLAFNAKVRKTIFYHHNFCLAGITLPEGILALLNIDYPWIGSRTSYRVFAIMKYTVNILLPSNLEFFVYKNASCYKGNY
jgi:hypothetical protein